jgi:hypothetical protein
VADGNGVVGTDALCSFFSFRVAAAFRPACLRFLVSAAFLPAVLSFRVLAAFLPAALRFLVRAAFFAAALRFAIAPSSLWSTYHKPTEDLLRLFDSTVSFGLVENCHG